MHDLHPLVAELAAALVIEGDRLLLPEDAQTTALAAIRAISGDKDADVVLADLIALGAKWQRVAPLANRDQPNWVLVTLAVVLVGAERAGDAFAGTELAVTANVIGRDVAMRAPAPAAPTRAAVKTVRGLKKAP